jgi:acetyl esterase
MPLTLTSVTESAKRGAARFVDALPASAARRLVGDRLDADGQVLDPHLALVLRLEERINGAAVDVPVALRRARTRESGRIAGGVPVAVGRVRDLTVDGAAGPLRARHYAPASGGADRPLVVFFHGGGWVVGDLESHDQPCRLICRYADVHVLAIDYRLAPEHPFPAAVGDAVASFAWAVAHAAELGADPARIAVAGDSAGGNLAAVVAQATRDAGDTAPCAQLLIYPGADASRDRPSKDLFAEGYFLSRADMDWFLDQYCPGVDRHDPRISPLLHPDLRGLAPAVVSTAAFDPLRDEGEAYASALREAGVPTVLRRAPGLVHAYFSMTGVHSASRDEALAVIGAFSALLDTAG